MSQVADPNEKPDTTVNNIARQRTNTRASSIADHNDGGRPSRSTGDDVEMNSESLNHHDEDGLQRFKRRFFRHGRKKVGILDSFKRIATHSWLNVFLVFLPLAWAGRFVNYNAEHAEEHHEEYHPTLSQWPPSLTFAFCLLGLMPLERTFEYAGEQLSFYLGRALGALISITLNNLVEATLAIILLQKCEIILVESTIIGVIVLHLLLIPGVSFLVGGSRVFHQELSPTATQLNHSLLTIGVLSLLLPLAFFATLGPPIGGTTNSVTFINDDVRGVFLKLSRGLAVVLLIVYICSRIYMHNPPGEDNAMKEHPETPEALKKKERHFIENDPEVNQWVMIGVLVVLICIMAATAEWLVESVEWVREEGRVTERFFGIVILPLVSYAADGAVTLIFFIHYAFRRSLGNPKPPSTLAEADAIDMSIQYTLFWMPFLVLLGWWTDKPMSLLFDYFEVAIAIGACFMVNYVTADAKTNWAEGMTLLAFYVIIVVITWWYHGQAEIEIMTTCGSIASAINEVLANGAHSAAGETAEQVSATVTEVAEHAARTLGLI